MSIIGDHLRDDSFRGLYVDLSGARFIEIRPQVCQDLTAGSEPPLFDIIKHYYVSSGIDKTEAERLTTAYVREWIHLENP